MRTVWHFQLPLFGANIEMPLGTEIVHVGIGPTTDEDHVSMWGLVNPSMVLLPISYVVIGTGLPVTDYRWKYVGTAVDPARPLVWHVFETNPSRNESL